MISSYFLLTSLATRLSLGATGLDSELLAPGLELVHGLGGPSGEVHVDGGPHASAQVGGAGVDVSVLLGAGVVLASLGLDGISDSLDAAGKTGKDTLDISSLLHGDDAGLVLLVDPHQEGLGGIVEDSTALGPVTLHTSNSQVAVSGDEEEVVINKLLSDLLIHASEWVVLSGKVTREGGSSILHEVLNSNTLLFGDSRAEAKSINGSSDPDSGRVNRNITVDVALDFSSIHIRGVL